jgi:hypothetical protein
MDISAPALDHEPPLALPIFVFVTHTVALQNPLGYNPHTF